MKVKFKNSRREGPKLTVETAVGEDLLYAEAECVKAGCNETLLTFFYDKHKKGYAFRYYIGTAKPLNDYLKHPLSNDYFEAMLVSFLHLAQACEARSLSIQRVMFVPDYIFFDPVQFTLKFAYLPVRQRKEKVSDPLQALAYIIERASFDNGLTKSNADEVLDHVRRSAIFSWIDYERLLKDLGVIDRRRAVLAGSDQAHGRITAQVDCRDMYGLDFISRPRKAAVREVVPVSAPASVSRGGGGLMLVRVFDGRCWELPEGRTIVGSSCDCDLALDDVNGLSRKHAEIVVKNGECFMRDLDSTNGTGIAGCRIGSERLMPVPHGSRIQLAKTQFEIAKG